MKRTLSRCLVPFLAASLPVMALAQDGSVSFDRPMEVGTKTRLIAEGSIERRQATRMDGIPLPDDVVVQSGRLEAIAEVLAVDEKKLATRVRYELVKFTMKTAADAADNEPLPAGTIVYADVTGTEVNLRLESGDIAAEYGPLLDLIIQIPTGDTTNEEYFGATGAKKAGDTWAVHPEGVIESMQRHQVVVLASDISGTVTCIGPAKHEGIDCTEVKADLFIKRLPYVGDLPPAVTLVESSLKGDFRCLLPVTKGAPAALAEATGVHRQVLSGRVGEELRKVDVEITITRKSKASLRLEQ